jgi:hypothetical protein
MRYNHLLEEIAMKTGLFKFLKTYLALALVLTVIGWGGLFLIVRNTLPTLGPRWLFFFLGVLALTGPAIPITFFLNQRFPSDPPVAGMVVLRQALWVGVFGSMVAWLQLGRVLNGGLALILAAAFVMIELLLRLFERSHWNPKKDE